MFGYYLNSYLEMLIALVLLVLILVALSKLLRSRPRVGDRIGYWHLSLAGLNETPERFYAQMYQALQQGLQEREIALTGFGFGPAKLFEGRPFFSRRVVYLCVRYHHLTYYVYGSPTPSGFFVSSWLYSRYTIGEAGRIQPSRRARAYFERQTLFQHDAVLMFTESVHAILLEIVDSYRNEAGLRPLEEAERRPILHAFYQSVMPVHPELALLSPAAGLSRGLSQESANLQGADTQSESSLRLNPPRLAPREGHSNGVAAPPLHPDFHSASTDPAIPNGKPVASDDDLAVPDSKLTTPLDAALSDLPEIEGVPSGKDGKSAQNK